MKRIAKFLCLPLLCAALCVSAFASSGLGAFTDARAYRSGQFSDVAGGAWYESAVKTVYQKGVMEGADGKFLPDKPITWAEAATITARLHAAYQGNDIPKAEGAWYQQYLDYDETNGLLPASCPAAAEAGTAQIAREDLCLLMRGVLSEDDLPVINDSSVPDINAAAAAARDAVRDMYAAGIFTGKDGGKFQPKAAATRAEIATVVSRLLCPAQRVGADSRANQAMKDQYGNFMQGGVVVSVGDTSYYLVKESDQKDDDYITRCSIVARTDDGKLSTVYTVENRRLDRLSAADDGSLYFLESNPSDEKTWSWSLRRLDPKRGTAETLYTAYWINFYTIYDGKIYILEELPHSTNDEIDDWPYRLGRLDGKTFTPLMPTMKYAQAAPMDDSMYCFGGKLYFIYGDVPYTYGGGKYSSYYDSLWSIDLDTGEQSVVIDARDVNGGLGLYQIAYSGATAYLIYNRNNDGDSVSLMRVNLLMPDLVETVAPLSQEALKVYIHMYANGSDLYYQSSTAQRLWKVSPSGEFTELFKLDTPYIDYSSIGKQAVVIHALGNVWQLYNEQIDVYPAGGEKTNYLAFLGKPYLIEGEAGLVPAGEAQTRTEGKDFEDGFSEHFTRTFFTARGDLAIELRVVNGTSADIPLDSISFEVKTDKTTYYPKLRAKPLAKGAERLYTLVIPVESLQGSAEVLDLSAGFYGG